MMRRPGRIGAAVVIGVLLAVIVVAVGLGGVGTTPATAHGAGTPVATAHGAGTPVASDRGAVDPTLTVEGSVDQPENVTATVGLPATANETRTFRVRLEHAFDHPFRAQDVTLAPGESTTIDFGACLPAESYTVRVLDAKSNVLVAGQTTVEEPDARLEFTDSDRYGSTETVRRDETLTVQASLHECVDHVTYTLRPADGTAEQNDDATGTGDSTEDGPVWRATVVDEDDDGMVTIRWTAGATAADQVAAGEGDRLVNTTTNRTVDGYGDLVLEAAVDQHRAGRLRVSVSFADPTLQLYRAPETATARAAIDSVASDIDSENATGQFVEGEWIVVRIDTDGTLDSLPPSASLAAPDRHENVTVQVIPRRTTSRDPDLPFDLANATRRFDAANDTLWYAFEANESLSAARIRYVAIGETRNATATATVSVDPPVSLFLPDASLFPPSEAVGIAYRSALPAGETLTFTVHAAGDEIARDVVTVGSTRGPSVANLSFADVPNGTNATLRVTHDGEPLRTEPIRIASEPVVQLDGFDVDGVRSEQANDVDVFLRNSGTAPDTVEVMVTIGDASTTETVRLEPRSGRRVSIRVPARGLELEERVAVTVRAGDDVEKRVVEVVHPDETGTEPNATATTTEPWPTLAGTREPTTDGPLPGFDGVVAVAGLALVMAWLAIRTRTQS